MRLDRRVTKSRRCGLTCVALAGWLAMAPAQGMSAPAPADRLVHRFLEVRISPDAKWVASIEGDPPVGGYHPAIRDLVIRRRDGRVETRIPLPCGRVPECWPGSLAWTPDSKRLGFTLRTPGSHAYALYSVAPDGRGLAQLLDFSGTLVDLKYSNDGTLAMLAVENARKEVGATEAGAPIAGDLDAPPAEQRIAILAGGALRWASPPDLFVYEYDWRSGRPGLRRHGRAGRGRQQLVDGEALCICAGHWCGTRDLRAGGHPSAARGAQGVARRAHGRVHRRTHERFRLERAATSTPCRWTAGRPST